MQSDLSFTIPVYDVFSLRSTVLIHRSQESTSASIDIALRGYLPKTPTKPGTAVSFKTLELFHRIRLRKPSMSVEAFAKVVADYYAVSKLFC